jgi:hypothetical protein
VEAGLLQHDNTWWRVQDLWLDLAEAGLTGEDLSPAQLVLLEGFAASEELGASNAKAWLASLGGAIDADVILPSDLRSLSIGNNTATTLKQQNFLAVHPNPTRGEAFVVFELPTGAETASLGIMDNTGRVLLHKTLPCDSGIADLPTILLPPGLYHAVLYADGLRVAQVKFTAIR